MRDAKDLQNALIFCNRKREVAVVYKSLQKHGFAVGALHGDMDQSARTAALEQFRKGEIPVLVASDVAARGLDIPIVSHVYNFDVPHHADDYVHRIGRTGRAGRSGTAISIVTSLDFKSMAAIEKLIGQSIPQAEGDFTVAAEASEDGDHPREHRKRERSREGFARRTQAAPRTRAAPRARAARRTRTAACHPGTGQPRPQPGPASQGGPPPAAANPRPPRNRRTCPRSAEQNRGVRRARKPSRRITRIFPPSCCGRYAPVDASLIAAHKMEPPFTGRSFSSVTVTPII